ncbi:GDSL esterase/lipase At4g10955 isoform X1 [Nicotiana tabacum]|uniref:GDSL esterase/lipase At4g10955 isoform X1 n=1 Tax=Nicotiana tabacum TaxID=4097 RepID=A0A1S4C9R2_TOBAC|nr:GDSL esterase/lipase At4g10955 [Nicotiana tomentosiformis]XP_016497851.1 PREDICTED: GDSL esterase/lipase At4g10955-like isoform X1 [Nicotiana tabacum]
MAKISAEEMRNEAGTEGEIVKESATESHPYAFHVSGPRNVSSPNWRDLINSSWKDTNYRRTVMACFIQAVYLIELDRQENRTEQNALAPKWWIPFKYKLVETLKDERDGSIFGAILEWDRSAALADFVLIRPSGAPRAVLALRGTLLKSPTMRRDIEDDLRFLAWESLKGSVRFNGALKALKALANKYGSNNVCIAGHSLGAGFALQVGKSLAKEGIYVEAHLFNPPSVSLAMSFRNIGEKAGFAWKRLKAMLPSKSDSQISYEEGATTSIQVGLKQWVPHLYINNSDYICCSYTDPDGAQNDQAADKENAKPTIGQAAAKLFLSSKGKQKFLEAHGLEQWWSDNLELQMAISNSKLISQQLKSLYTLPASQLTPGKR